MAEHCNVVAVEKYVFGRLVLTRERRCPAHGTTPVDVAPDPVSTIGTGVCDAGAAILRLSPDEYCGRAPVAQPAVTAPLVARALRRIPIPPAKLLVQPPNGRTLVHFATNFYTEREEFTRNVRLLGQRVELRITPAQFTWHFDDGESTTTSTPGAPYPRLEVTHDYLAKGAVRPSVDTTYTAVFRVGAGAWQPVPGSVTIAGESVTLDVVEASPILVGYR